MADNYGNPFQGMLNPNMRQTSLWDLRMMSAANRSETPFERGSRGMYAHQGLRGDPSLAGLAAMSNEPDYSQFTYDPQAHAAAQKALSPYGLSPLEASQVKQNVVLPNSGFFGNHPRLSAALEGGMFGALASHGGETPGESIQGVLEGVVGGQRMRQGLQRQQFARPFEAAGMMEQMSDMQQKRELQEADIQHLRATNQKLGRPDHAYQVHPLTKSDPGYLTVDTETGESKYSQNPDYDPALVGRTQRANDWSGYGTDRTAIAQELYPNKGPHELSQAEMANVNKTYETRLGTAAFNRGRGSTEGRLSTPGELTPQQKEHVDTIRSQMNKLDTREETSRLRQEVMLDKAFQGKPLDDINKEVENRRETRRKTFQGQIDDIMNPPKDTKPKMLVEQPDGTFKH